MKKRLFAIALALTMVFTCSCGKDGQVASATDEAPPVDYAAAYAPVLDAYYKLIFYGEADEIIGDYTGLMGLLSYEDYDKIADDIGYAIKDISGDGVPELLMSFITEETEEGIFGRDLFAVYHYGGGDPQLTFEGWARNSYSLLDGTELLYQGSGGAIYSIFGTYYLSDDGAELLCNDYYFTYEKDETFEDIGCYHNITGEWDKAVSEELDLTLDEFWQIEADLEEDVVLINLTPFADYVPVSVPVYEAPASDKEAWVKADYADGIVTEATNYDWFTADDSPDSTKVLFMAEGNVRDFKFLSLYCEDVLEDGTPVFTTEELYQTDRLDPERPLLVEMTFWGTIPSYGISYMDQNGETRNFTVEMSGMDGSIHLGEF